RTASAFSSASPPAATTRPVAPAACRMVLGVPLGIILDGQPAGHGEMAPGHAFEVGRHGSGLRIDDNLLSRRHFVLETVENDLFLEDLGSANGTYLNGDEVKGRVALKDGDRIEAGKSALIVHLSSFEAQRIGETGWLVTEIRPESQAMPHLGLKRGGGGGEQGVTRAARLLGRVRPPHRPSFIQPTGSLARGLIAAIGRA